MVSLTGIGAALSSLRSAKDIAQSMVAARDIAVFQEGLVNLRGEIISAQEATLDAQEERAKLMDCLKELEKEITALKAWDGEKGRYELRDLRPPKGVFVYALKADRANGEPEHSLCSTCFQRGKKSILQQETRFPGRASVLVCHECGSDFYVGGSRETGHPAPRTGSARL